MLRLDGRAKQSWEVGFPQDGRRGLTTILKETGCAYERAGLEIWTHKETKDEITLSLLQLQPLSSLSLVPTCDSFSGKHLILLRHFIQFTDGSTAL